MALKNFTIQDLQTLDGGAIAIAIDHDMRRAVTDCLDRPGNKRPRSVVLKIHLTPQMLGNDCDGVNVDFEINASIPKKSTRSYTMKPNLKGQLIFNENSPNNPDQASFLDSEEASNG
jgi:hypothetical protein